MVTMQQSDCSHTLLCPGSGCRVQSQTKTFTTLCLPGMMELFHLWRQNIVKEKNEYFEDCQDWITIRIRNSAIHRDLLSSIDNLQRLNIQFNSLLCYYYVILCNILWEVWTNFDLLGVSVKFVSTVLRRAWHHNAVTDVFVHKYTRCSYFIILQRTPVVQKIRSGGYQILCILQFLAQCRVLLLAAAVCSLIGLIELGWH